MPFDPHVLWGLGKSRSPSTNTQAGQAVSQMSVYLSTGLYRCTGSNLFVQGV